MSTVAKQRVIAADNPRTTEVAITIRTPGGSTLGALMRVALTPTNGGYVLHAYVPTCRPNRFRGSCQPCADFASSDESAGMLLLDYDQWNRLARKYREQIEEAICDALAGKL